MQRCDTQIHFHLTTLISQLNGHVGTTSVGFEAVHGGFGYGSRNQEGEEVLDFAVACDLMIATLSLERENLI